MVFFHARLDDNEGGLGVLGFLLGMALYWILGIGFLFHDTGDNTLAWLLLLLDEMRYCYWSFSTDITMS